MRSDARLEAFVAVTDLDRARSFYVGVLGLTPIEDNGFALVVAGGGARLRITPVAAMTVAPYTVLGWAVDDLDAAVAELRGGGVVFTRYDGMEQDGHDAWTAPDGTRVAWFTDPDGNVLSFSQSPAPP